MYVNMKNLDVLNPNSDDLGARLLFHLNWCGISQLFILKVSKTVSTLLFKILHSFIDINQLSTVTFQSVFSKSGISIRMFFVGTNKTYSEYIVFFSTVLIGIA